MTSEEYIRNHLGQMGMTETEDLLFEQILVSWSTCSDEHLVILFRCAWAMLADRLAGGHDVSLEVYHQAMKEIITLVEKSLS